MTNTPETLFSTRYRLQDKLGEGGMGVVYRATDRLTGDTIALKQVQVPTEALAFMSRPPKSVSQNMQLALGREFQTLASLRHPHIISVLDYGFVQTDTEPQPFYTMTYLPAAAPLLAAGAQLSVAGKLALIRQSLQGLAYLHRRGILHRDLKPENVLVMEGQVRILDFGLATQRDETRSGSSGGTAAYLAPEVWDGAPASPASDLYALGVMVFEMLTGQHPFGSLDESFVDRIFDDEPDLDRLGVAGALAEVVGRLLAKTPEARYKWAQEVLAALDTALGVPSSGESEVVRESFLQAARFVGRKAELAQLTKALKQTVTGQSLIWLIGGESGVGKTRLADEVRTQAMLQGLTVMQGQGVEGGGVPFQLWREPARHLLLMHPDIPALQAGILKDLVPDIEKILGREVADAPKLDGRAYQQRLILAMVDLFRNLPKPVLLLLEDLQWASESLAVLQQMGKIMAQLPGVMVLGTYRDDERENLPKKLPGAQVLRLARLDRMDIARLTLSMLGSEIIQRTNIVSLLLRETEGNAYFLVEVMRALAEEAGQLDEIGQMTLPEGVFTGGMARLLQRRIQKVKLDDQPLLQLAALAGRQLNLRLLAVLAQDVEVEAWLHRISEATILIVRENRWEFAHDKLREAALIDLNDETRQALHRQIALALEQIYPDDVNQYKTLLDHWHQAGDLDREIYYLVLVVKELIEIAADYDLAHTLLERILQTLPEGNIHRISLWNWKAESYIRQESYAQAQGLARQAQELAQRMEDNSGVATSLNCLGLVAFFQGDYLPARDYFQKSLAIRQAIGNQQDIATSLHSLGLVAFYQDDYEQAHDYYQQSLAIRRTLGDQIGIARSLSNLGNVVGSQGNREQAQDYYQQSLAIRHTVGTRHSQTITLPNLGLVYLDLSSDHAYASLRDALSLAQSIRAYSVMLEIVVGFAWLNLHEGHLVHAGELTGLAQHHPAHDNDVQIALDELWPQLEATLAPADLRATLARGKNLDLEQVVSELLGNS